MYIFSTLRKLIKEIQWSCVNRTKEDLKEKTREKIRMKNSECRQEKEVKLWDKCDSLKSDYQVIIKHHITNEAF